MNRTQKNSRTSKDNGASNEPKAKSAATPQDMLAQKIKDVKPDRLSRTEIKPIEQRADELLRHNPKRTKK